MEASRDLTIFQTVAASTREVQMKPVAALQCFINRKYRFTCTLVALQLLEGVISVLEEVHGITHLPAVVDVVENGETVPKKKMMIPIRLRDLTTREISFIPK